MRRLDESIREAVAAGRLLEAAVEAVHELRHLIIARDTGAALVPEEQVAENGLWWGKENLKAEHILGGVTNLLVKVTDSLSKRTILLRYYGRPEEAAAVQRVDAFLKLHGLGKTIFYSSEVFQIEEWIEGRAIDLDTMRSPSASTQIAKAMAKLHSLPVFDFIQTKTKSKIGGGNLDCGDDFTSSTLVKEHPRRDLETDSDISSIWGRVLTSLDTIARRMESLETETTPEHRKFDLERLQELRNKTLRLRTTAKAVKASIAFCHNDLLNGNILALSDGCVQFIDFEYAGPTERAFDIANHFCEWCGFECNWDKFPSKEQQENFLRAYLAALKEHSSERGLPSGPPSFDVLRNEVNIFINVSHLFWGLWGLEQSLSASQCVDFDFLSYAFRRLGALGDKDGDA